MLLQSKDKALEGGTELKETITNKLYAPYLSPALDTLAHQSHVIDVELFLSPRNMLSLLNVGLSIRFRFLQ
jgi:hypothetical protein